MRCALMVVVALLLTATADSSASPSLTRAAIQYGWPLAPPHPVTRPFVAPSTPFGPGHRGVDLGANARSPVLAAGDGTVTFAGQVAGRGVITVRHEDGLRTTYEPVSSVVRRGAQIHRGQRIGLLVAGHDCRSARWPVCLHWGAKRGAEYVDPLGLLAQGRVRLLPWRDP